MENKMGKYYPMLQTLHVQMLSRVGQLLRISHMHPFQATTIYRTSVLSCISTFLPYSREVLERCTELHPYCQDATCQECTDASSRNVLMHP
jgi:hypothetical protein